MSNSRPGRFSVLLSDPSLMLAVPATVLYYAVMAQPQFRESLLARYTTGHVVEYVIVAMFIWGAIDIIFKLCSFPRELWALRQQWLPPRDSRVPIAQAEVFLQNVSSQPPRLLSSRIGQRLVSALSFVVENKSAEELPDQLRYLADQNADATHHRYSLVGFVIALTPILGFIGTVVHFGTALTGMTVDGIGDELSHVVSEMGTAFNTTTSALAAAMIMMISRFMCDRVDKGIDRRTDRLVERELLHRFEVKAANVGPLASILERANNEFHAAAQKAMQQQTAAWSAALKNLFDQFEKRQQHEEQRWQSVSASIQERHRSNESTLAEQLQRTLKAIDERHEKHLARIQTTVQEASKFSGDMSALAKTLDGIARGEGRLLDLQKSLADNLKLLHDTNQIDAALHGLTAAIHLLTVRHQDTPQRKAA
ncbi:MAG: MotA/TolQ/ExbB proton channel family protein [Planctomycetaceae bacterium]